MPGGVNLPGFFWGFMKLTELMPRERSFYLSATKKTYTLRKLNLEDEVWLAEALGNQKLSEIFGRDNGVIDMESICKIVYRQMEDRTDFKKENIVDYDDSGEEIQREIGGYKKLMHLLEYDEVEDFIWALNETLGISRPKVEKELKKKSSKKKVTKKKVTKKAKKKQTGK